MLLPHLNGGTAVELKGLERHHLHEEYRKKLASSIDATAVNAQPLVRVGEQGFAAPVVCCCLPPAYPSAAAAAVDEDSVEENLLDDADATSWAGKRGLAKAMVLGGTKRSVAMKELMRWDPLKLYQPRGPLLVALANGDARLYDTSDLHSLSQSRMRSYRSIFSNFASVHGDNANSMHSVVRDASRRHQQRVESNDTDDSEGVSRGVVLQLGQVAQSKVPFLQRQRRDSDAEDGETVYSDDVRDIVSVNDSFLTRVSPKDLTARGSVVKKSSLKHMFSQEVSQQGLTTRKSVTYADDSPTLLSPPPAPPAPAAAAAVAEDGDEEQPQPRAQPPVPLFPLSDSQLSPPKALSRMMSKRRSAGAAAASTRGDSDAAAAQSRPRPKHASRSDDHDRSSYNQHHAAAPASSSSSNINSNSNSNASTHRNTVSVKSSVVAGSGSDAGAADDESDDAEAADEAEASDVPHREPLPPQLQNPLGKPLIAHTAVSVAFEVFKRPKHPVRVQSYFDCFCLKYAAVVR